MAVTVKGPPRNLRTIECSSCECVLEFLPKDVRRHRADYDVGDTEDYDYVVCPSCRKHAVIPKAREYYDL